MDTRTLDATEAKPCTGCGAVAPHCHLQLRDVRDVIRDALVNEGCILRSIVEGFRATGIPPEDTDRAEFEQSLRDIRRAFDWLSAVTPTFSPDPES